MISLLNNKNIENKPLLIKILLTSIVILFVFLVLITNNYSSQLFYFVGEFIYFMRKVIKAKRAINKLYIKK